MMQYRFDDIDSMQALVSEEFSDWGPELQVTQAMIDQFAELSGDHYWLHTDPQKCEQMSPFGTTIAHGFFTLILLPQLGRATEWEVTGFNNMLNYGSNKLRFTGAVPVESRLHARLRVKEVSKSDKGTLMVMEQQVNIVGQQRPVLVYELILMYM